MKLIHCVLELNYSQWLKPYVEFNTPKKNRSRKNDDKDGKVFYKFINNAAFSKTMKNCRNIIYVKLVSDEKDCLKWT